MWKVLPFKYCHDLLQSESGGGSEEGVSSGGTQGDGSEKGSSRIDEEEAELNLLDDEASSSQNKADYALAQSVSFPPPIYSLNVNGFLSTF
jgi:hypothetical protein